MRQAALKLAPPPQGVVIDVDHWNRTLGRKYPVIVEDKGWVYGLWYCGRSWGKVLLYGQYPPGFLARVLALFPSVSHERILHCPSGTVSGPGVTVDIVKDEASGRRPQIQAPADHLPFGDNRFSLVISDPPYSAKDSEIYGCDPFPMRGFMAEAARVLEPGGILAMLHVRTPVHRRAEWKLDGIFGVSTGTNRAMRVFSLFRNLKKGKSA